MVQFGIEQAVRVRSGRGGLGYSSTLSLTSALDRVGG
jgi:hypothetical protein